MKHVIIIKFEIWSSKNQMSLISTPNSLKQIFNNSVLKVQYSFRKNLKHLDDQKKDISQYNEFPTICVRPRKALVQV